MKSVICAALAAGIAFGSPFSNLKPRNTPSQCYGQLNPPPEEISQEWSGWGGNVYNNRWASNNFEITGSSAANLNRNCRIPFKDGVSATPVVSGDIAYFPTWNGLFVAVAYKTCDILWQINVTDLITQFGPVAPDVAKIIPSASRSSPQIDNGILYFTTLAHALLVAADVSTGAVLGMVQLDSHPYAILTMSPTVYNGRLFIGVSSSEESAAGFLPDYKCCSFLGSMAAFDFDPSSNTFYEAWRVSMLPKGQGWSGAAVWGSQPSIDIARNQVFIGTGNVYTIPKAYRECERQLKKIKVVQDGHVSAACTPRDNYQEAIMAFDLDTGFVNWIRQLSPLDAWEVACGLPTYGIHRNKTECPFSPGPDADFGMSPVFVPGSQSTPHGIDTVVIGQKNGELHAVSAQAGTLLWSTVTSPDGTGGGLSWGLAVDESQVYFTAINSEIDHWRLLPSNELIVNSAFGAASLRDGSLVWEVASPHNSSAYSPPTVVNDVVFFGRTGENITGDYQATRGGLVVIDKVTGSIVQEAGLDTNFHGGMAIQDNYIMFGSGYSGSTSRNGSFHAWTVGY